MKKNHRKSVEIRTFSESQFMSLLFSDSSLMTTPVSNYSRYDHFDTAPYSIFSVLLYININIPYLDRNVKMTDVELEQFSK